MKAMQQPHTLGQSPWFDNITRELPGGMELDKVLAKRVTPELESADEPDLKPDSFTIALIRRHRHSHGSAP